MTERIAGPEARAAGILRCVDCGVYFALHGYHWCTEVCSNCLATYRLGWGPDYAMYRDRAGFWDAAGRQRIRANIASHGGRYVPHFNDGHGDGCAAASAAAPVCLFCGHRGCTVTRPHGTVTAVPS